MKKRRHNKVDNECSKMDIANKELYIGGTTNRATNEIIEKILVKCAKNVDNNIKFKVTSVEQLKS